MSSCNPPTRPGPGRSLRIQILNLHAKRFLVKNVKLDWVFSYDINCDLPLWETGQSSFFFYFPESGVHRVIVSSRWAPKWKWGGAWQWHKRLAPGAWGQGGTVPRNSWQPSLSVVSEVHLSISANQLKVGKKQHSWGEGGCEVGKHLRDVCFDVWQLRNRVTFARSKPSGAGQTRNFWIKMRELVAGSRQHSSESQLSRTSLPPQHVVNC